MQRITETAEAVHARMIVLKTQSCNEAAIAFYQKYGFSIIGIDLYSYSNTGPEQHHVRIEMVKKLDARSKLNKLQTENGATLRSRRFQSVEKPRSVPPCTAE